MAKSQTTTWKTVRFFNLADRKTGLQWINSIFFSRTIFRFRLHTSFNKRRGWSKYYCGIGNDQHNKSHKIVAMGSRSTFILVSIHRMNRIRMCDRYLRFTFYCSYYIETSVNQTNGWERVIDHTKYHCRSWQSLYFPSRAVRYIKLIGTHNTCNRVFHVVALEAYYTAKVPTLVNGLILPTYNVATVDMSAVVIEGVSRTRNALLNGDVKNYDWDSGYTCHQLGKNETKRNLTRKKWADLKFLCKNPNIGSGVIVIQLGQPYCIGSLRLLLWDCDSRTYSFYIETSVNQKDWEMAVDKREEQLRSWQQFTFPPRAVVFFRIVGTYNTANEVRSDNTFVAISTCVFSTILSLLFFFSNKNRYFTAFISSVRRKIYQNKK